MDDNLPIIIRKDTPLFLSNTTFSYNSKKASPDLLRQCLEKLFSLLPAMRIETLALPALGAAFPGLTPQLSTDCIVQASTAAVKNGLALNELHFIVCDPLPYACFKRALKRHVPR